MIPFALRDTQSGEILEVILEALHKLDLNAGQYNAIAAMFIKSFTDQHVLCLQINNHIKYSKRALRAVYEVKSINIEEMLISLVAAIQASAKEPDDTLANCLPCYSTSTLYHHVLEEKYDINVALVEALKTHCEEFISKTYPPRRTKRGAWHTDN